MKRVIIQQADLDTCTAALVLGITGSHGVQVVSRDASAEDLADPSVVCIEAGGSGRPDLNNFDHHGAGASADPACVQALAGIRSPSESLLRLVRYVADVDLGRLGPAPLGTGHAMTLSSVFSGMRLYTPDPVEQFRAGISMLQLVVRRGLNPAGPLPGLPEWRAYVERKRQEWESAGRDRDRIERFTTAGGLQAGFFETPFVGALGLLYEAGCDVGIAYSPAFQSPSGLGQVPKYSIGCRTGLRVDSLLPTLNELEPGWGGPSHGTIIGSPRAGSRLSPTSVQRLVHRDC